MTTGVAAEFALPDLVRDGRLVGVGAAVDLIRTTFAVGLEQYLVTSTLVRDSHHNVIVPVSAAQLAESMEAGVPDLGLFQLFSQFAHGGDPPWFTDVYEFTGFMLLPYDRCRIYLRVGGNGEVHGIDIPLTHADGGAIYGLAGSLVQELATLVRVGDLSIQPKVDRHDDYCGTVFDMSEWVDPPAPAFPPAGVVSDSS
ncbi:hypothetical protein [Micromonospora psammae]|uniref:hypothetical protein n=1 Tax=Micromonospora sp. CPCC 205556 TaxID=3122398 RepID=UPI002FF2BCBF